MTRAVIFDLDETLYHNIEFTDQLLQANVQYMCRVLHVTADVVCEIRSGYIAQYGSTVKGLCAHVEDFNVHAYGEYLISTMDFGLLRRDDHLVHRVSRLGGVKAILTNNPRNYALHVLSTLNLLGEFPLDRIFCIDDTLPACKPDADAFDCVLRPMGLQPEDAILVDDTLANISAARKMGLGTVWMRGSEGVADAVAHTALEAVDIVQNAPRLFMKKSIVLPCRRGSSRCRDKSMRKFSTESLLHVKLREVLRCTRVHRIIVSTDDDEVMDVARSMGVSVHVRDPSLCVGDVPPRLVHAALAAASDEVFVYTSAAAPFVSHTQIDEGIKTWCLDTCDVVCAAKVERKFLWQNGRPLNFDMSQGLPPTQALHDVCTACADAFLVAERATVASTSCLMGDGTSVRFVDVSDVQCIDVDYNIDFVTAESIWSRHLFTDSSIDTYMQRGLRHTRVLDCTIRDSGYVNNWSWSYEFVASHVAAMGAVGVEYCEIGFLKNTAELGSGPWRCLNHHMPLVSRLRRETACKLAVMMDIEGPSDSYCDVSEVDLSDVSLVRVFTFVSLLDRALSVCDVLRTKGVSVSLNIGHCVYITSEQQLRIRDRLRGHAIDYLCFADSHGMCSSSDICQLLNYDYGVAAIGVHLHDNHGTVMANADVALRCHVSLIDATLSGIGKNGGNLSLEKLILHMHFNRGELFGINELLLYLEGVVGVVSGVDRSVIEWNLRTYMRVHASFLPSRAGTLQELFNHLQNSPTQKALK